MSTISILEHFGSIRRILNRLCLSQLTDLKLSVQQMIILRYLGKYREANMACIAAAIGSDKASVTRMITSLEKLKLVSKSSLPEDARQTILRLTFKSQKLIPQINEIYQNLATSLVAGLNNKEQEVFLELLLKIESSFD
ncbi:MAG: hypothetical protein COW00_06885 [Bdellovibrio sp. CG12_big_fil_rev_8_21_14_0_65_39_13]|nr:MAG: hypothetical protein COW78_03005 [Bdellovibrio sp. CG22_combo_CG10-13_8_21_14_all_39_27]PIQ60328.1 MAG: hypothetical protein COW00_06885 [Bdellovibrio sp. CG12_big_fil_rev_8_21_14_0_65_39_13]PIR35062.1 MAG: hypothetical protein COV37_10580 [Bdellovibrio sp. CG11_big_fil_rev_8_21_14_0_20_39_38]